MRSLMVPSKSVRQEDGPSVEQATAAARAASRDALRAALDRKAPVLRVTSARDRERQSRVSQRV